MMDLSFAENDPFKDSPFKKTMRSPTMQTYYDILGVDQGASKVILREVYIRLKKTYGTTSQALYSLIDEDGASEAMILIDEAFKTLDDDRLREKYDRELGLNLAKSGSTSTHSAFASRFDFKDKNEDDKIDISHRNKDGFEHLMGGIEATQVGSALKQSKRGINRVSNFTLSKEELEKICEGRDLGDGRLYREIREMLGVSLKDIYNKTRVMVNYLTDIEENNYAGLPAAVFVRGFVRSYLQCLGIAQYDHWAAMFVEKHISCLKQKK